MTLVFDRSLDVSYRTVDEVIPGIRRVVAENPGPYTFKGTATFIVGRGEVAIIDPGPNDSAHINALVDAIEINGEHVSHILVTHTHLDHSPGSRALQERTNAPTYGFGPHPSGELPHDEQYAEPTTEGQKQSVHSESDLTPAADKDSEAHGDQLFVPDNFTKHGDIIRGDTWKIEAVHTPGHLANHLCYGLVTDTHTNEQVLFTGDHVMGWSTSVISPPGGDLDDYLASLELLLTRRDVRFIPTHGSPIAEPHEFVRGLLAHRHDRTQQIIALLATGARPIPEIVSALYIGLDPRLITAAGRSVFAHLISLKRRGDVVRNGDTFALAR